MIGSLENTHEGYDGLVKIFRSGIAVTRFLPSRGSLIFRTSVVSVCPAWRKATRAFSMTQVVFDSHLAGWYNNVFCVLLFITCPRPGISLFSLTSLGETLAPEAVQVTKSQFSRKKKIAE